MLANPNISGDLEKCEVRSSLIPHVGLGLFATTHIVKGERITKYSDRLVPTEVARKTRIPYILYVNKRFCLDVTGDGNMADKYINDGSKSRFPVNARFGVSLRFYVCKESGRLYVSIFATKLIRPNNEILSCYGSSVEWLFPIYCLPWCRRTEDDNEQGNAKKKRRLSNCVNVTTKPGPTSTVSKINQRLLCTIVEVSPTKGAYNSCHLREG